ncbi:MAG TPA: UDP-N-acetylmuramate dehydrogenase [Candidatus Egerieimonas intestinavium]|uniref:UDP-N-acetylenolpyruvoylglucosamine reductase n=1 Tax=Candidatus Egerieimonas intestinavium TaxID=2840777 RepID=A0A9D1EIL9_9FIRM|nr:UDP-N-acetylmuramate dehydrogenase [Candidatus Egerieimonas intestinavium]
MREEIYHRFCEILGSDNVYQREPMAKHTTFRIGGEADYYLCPHSRQEIKEILNLCREEELPWFILGNGSNLLVSDSGYRGVIIQIYKNMCNCTVEGSRIRVQAGALLSKVSAEALKHGLTGMEFASGIPGTVGGAVMMNAGAYGGEMKQVLRQAVVLTPEGEELTLSVAELELDYRTSIIKEKGYVVLEAELELAAGDPEAIRGCMEELKDRRVAKQPLEYPSAGSTFKRPQGHFAGKLIMDAGLRGYQVGGAQISTKHCGFVINVGDATAADVQRLIQDVQAKVKERFGVELEPEVQFLGDFQ